MPVRQLRDRREGIGHLMRDDRGVSDPHIRIA